MVFDTWIYTLYFCVFSFYVLLMTKYIPKWSTYILALTHFTSLRRYTEVHVKYSSGLYVKLLTTSGRVFHQHLHFSAKVLTVLVISHERFQYLCFCLCSSHWFEVGGLSSVRCHVFPHTRINIYQFDKKL